MSNDGFDAADFRDTAELLRSDNDAMVRATMSNRLNIILAALDRCASEVPPEWVRFYNAERPTNEELNYLVGWAGSKSAFTQAPQVD